MARLTFMCLSCLRGMLQRRCRKFVIDKIDCIVYNRNEVNIKQHTQENWRDETMDKRVWRLLEFQREVRTFGKIAVGSVVYVELGRI